MKEFKSKSHILIRFNFGFYSHWNIDQQTLQKLNRTFSMFN